MSLRPTERTNAIVALAGLTLLLVASPLSGLVTAAVVLTMLGVVVTLVLTANPVRVARSTRAARSRAETPER